MFPDVLFSYEANHAEPPWSYRWIALQGRRVTEMLENIGVTITDPIVRGANSTNLASIFELEHKSGQTITTLATDGWFRLPLAEFARLNANKSHYSSAEVLTDSERLVEQAIRWFQTQYMLPISIEKLAASLGYHRTHFTKVFKQQQFKKWTGASPTQYRDELKRSYKDRF
ncbi:hypothetical protein [Paenibacillus ottowii]|uniref:hypothetical protein n=1 Tax=Paenibacillus ottowii TaxID=2315729 RepID=UPI001FCB61AE|nr:hypothetical protein [Paenibacillus ottowii]